VIFIGSVEEEAAGKDSEESLQGRSFEK